jgi:acetolactate synthase I/II/III large subunit
MGRYSTAHYFLEGLVDLGVEYIFANLGTDHVSLIEEMARWDKEGRKHPEMILCPHEVVAVHMAGGYALATGRAQAVLVTPARPTPAWRSRTCFATGCR